jgi:hypothetical protein
MSRDSIPELTSFTPKRRSHQGDSLEMHQIDCTAGLTSSANESKESSPSFSGHHHQNCTGD